jgi:hypothetical protein
VTSLQVDIGFSMAMEANAVIYHQLLHRRQMLAATAAGLGGLVLPRPAAAAAPDYQGPRVLFIRFGGGTRRRESIAPNPTSYSPFLLHRLVPRGVLFNNMTIGSQSETGHGQGTLNLLTGIYDKYKDVNEAFLGERFEARVPTLFEYLRKEFDVPEHQALIINGEDRTQEEFYTFSNHHLFGARFRSQVLSLYRFKTWLLEQQIARDGDGWSAEKRAAKVGELHKMKALDYRDPAPPPTNPEIASFWQRWRDYYGESGLVNPRGDGLLTELAVRAMRELEPRLVMINFNDCDYVHWGNMSHYTRAISIMDRSIERLFETINSLEAYRDNTLLVIAPDCGRDDSRFAAVPCQHHFNSRSAREVFALFVGPGIDRGRVVDKPTEQIEVAATVGRVLGLTMPHAEGRVLEEAFA